MSLPVRDVIDHSPDARHVPDRADDTVSVIACPVDDTENDKLTDHLGQLTQPI
jgi:hypothetical protein